MDQSTTMKRKGQEAVSSGTAVVMSPPVAETKCSNDDSSSSSFACPSPFSPSSSARTLEEIKAAMEKLLLMFDGPTASDDMNVLRDNTNILQNLNENVNQLKCKSGKIRDEIQSRIQDSSEQLDQEKESLRMQKERVNEKRAEVDRVKRNISELIKKEMELKMKIDQHKKDASQEVEEIDEVEEEKKAEVFRLQQHVSLLAHISGIKWDYDCIDSIAGEVDIPSENKHLRFEFDKERYSSFEIANMLWKKIGS